MSSSLAFINHFADLSQPAKAAIVSAYAVNQKCKNQIDLIVKSGFRLKSLELVCFPSLEPFSRKDLDILPLSKGALQQVEELPLSRWTLALAEDTRIYADILVSKILFDKNSERRKNYTYDNEEITYDRLSILLAIRDRETNIPGGISEAIAEVISHSNLALFL